MEAFLLVMVVVPAVVRREWRAATAAAPAPSCADEPSGAGVPPPAECAQHFVSAASAALETV
jgi:hypothetical protein